MEKKLARIIATASYLPEKVLSNKDLEEMVDTTDEWITSRTGMQERRIAAENQASSDLGIEAANAVLKKGKIAPEEIDLILVATSTPDHLMPCTAALIGAAVGAVDTPAVDMQAACTGYLYVLSAAKAYIESGMAKTVLVVATEKNSAFIDYQDRSTCVLFGDGAAASIVSDQGEGLMIESIDLGADGNLSELFIIPAGGSRLPASQKTVAERSHFCKMQGSELFRNAVKRMGSSLEACLSQAGLKKSDISWLVPHQANNRILEALAKQLSLPIDKVRRTLHKYGNTSSASCPVTLAELLVEEPLRQGERIALVAFGAGLTWGAAVLKKI